MKRILQKYKCDIELIEERIGKRIMPELEREAERNKTNFLSKISEVIFGGYLIKIFSIDTNIEYEPTIQRKKPDWLIDSFGDKIIFEVLKINIQNEELETKIELFEKNKFHPNYSEVYLGLGCLNRNDRDKILNKEKKYRELVCKYDYKLVICIDASDWDKKIDVQDIKTTFNFGNNHTFHHDGNFNKNINGLFVKSYYGDIDYIPNPDVIKELNQNNLKILKEKI